MDSFAELALADEQDIFKLALSGSFLPIIAYLSTDQTYVNEVIAAEQGYTLLHAAAFHGNVKAIATLLQFGADPDRQDSQGQTALHIALQFNYNVQVCETLANVTRNAASYGQLAIKNNRNDAYMLLKREGDKDSEGNTDLHIACALGHASIAYQCELNNESNAFGVTPLMLAAKSKQLQLFNYLLNSQQVQDFFVRDSHQDSLFDYCERAGHEYTALLEQKLLKAQKNWFQSHQKFNPQMALIYVQKSGFISLLVVAGVYGLFWSQSVLVLFLVCMASLTLIFFLQEVPHQLGTRNCQICSSPVSTHCSECNLCIQGFVKHSKLLGCIGYRKRLWVLLLQVSMVAIIAQLIQDLISIDERGIVNIYRLSERPQVFLLVAVLFIIAMTILDGAVCLIFAAWTGTVLGQVPMHLLQKATIKGRNNQVQTKHYIKHQSLLENIKNVFVIPQQKTEFELVNLNTQ